MADGGWLAADVERAMRTATAAEPIEPPEGWRLSGGTTTDGDPLIVEIDVLEQVVRIEAVAKG